MLEESETFTIYRFEKNGLGPFNGEWSSVDEDLKFITCFNDFSDWSTHPNPQNEGFDTDGLIDHRVGCKDIVQLLHWFGVEMHEILFNNGFHVYVYEVIEPVILGKQVVFEMHNVVSKQLLHDKPWL